jgi:hypothetical protein
MSTPFMVGDRVRARTSSSVPEGTAGCVQELLRHVRDIYYVLFDGHSRPTLMHAADLERIADEPQTERTV